MNEMVNVPLPTQTERKFLLFEYLERNVLDRARSSKVTNVEIDSEFNNPQTFDEILEEMASDERTGGMSGREIEKMCSSIFVSTIISSLVLQLGIFL